MKRFSRVSAAVVAIILLLITAAEATGQPTPPKSSLTLWQARRTVIEGLMATNHYYNGLRISSYLFTLDNLDIDTSDHQHFSIDLKSLPPVFYKYGFGVRCLLGTEKKLRVPEPLNKWAVDCASGPGERELYAVAKSFAAVLNRLRESAQNAEDPLRTFPQQATAWRALASKPPLPEEVRVQRLLAEDSVKNNKPEEALFRYETGLQLYPVWPQGYFNAALIAAELGFYGEAVEHMQAYLELVPEAPDAQAARDQIAIWKYKSNEAKSK